MKQLIIFALVCLPLLCACGGSQQKEADATYKTLTVTQSDQILKSDYTATLRGRQYVEIRPQVSGIITRICINEGDPVHKGQTLFIIDQVPYKAALETAVANVKSAEAKLATAKLTADSKAELYKEQIVSEFDLQTARNEQAAAEAALAQAKAQEVNKEIAKYVDVMIGNEEDFTASLGFEVEGNDAELKELNMDGYYKMIDTVTKAYPNFKVIATTLRTVKTATVNDWSAICWADGEIYKAKDYKGLEIMDRVGGGDSFASGLVYGLMTTGDAELAVNYGAAHGALAMTTPGDTTMATKKEVEAIMGGAGARVQR